MEKSKGVYQDRLRIWGIFLTLCAISAVHYLASTQTLYWHEIMEKAYYLPIVVAALWYGLPGGLLSAALASLLYLPHVIITWQIFPSFQLDQYATIPLFFVFGGLIGVLSGQQRKQRDRLEETAKQLTTLNLELQRSFESLRRTERLSALGSLSAGLAHELRNPLSAIEAAFNIVSRLDADPDRREEFRGIIRKELARLNEMLNHFLAFARPETPRRKLTDLRDLGAEVCNLVGGSLSTRHIQVRCKKTDFPRSMISCDSNQIKEVILNLVLNAADAMQEGGEIELSATEQGESLVISVKDQGAGIPDEELQRIFDPFYSTKPSGTGLGLSIASRIIEQHGGRIEVSRNPDRGMTFSLILPLEPAEALAS